MSDSRPGRILLTGFEPFGGDGHNPSWPAARVASVRLGELGLDAVAVRLHGSFAGSTEALDRALAEYRPGIVIACGLAAAQLSRALVIAALEASRPASGLPDLEVPDGELY